MSLIVIDETGFYFSSCGSNYGRGFSCVSVRFLADYTRREVKINVFAGIEAGNPIGFWKITTGYFCIFLQKLSRLAGFLARIST